MTYLLELISPFLLVTTCNLAKRSSFLSLAFGVLITANLFLTTADYEDFGSVRRKHPEIANWQNMADRVAAHQNVLGSPAIAPVLLENNRQVYDSGQSEYSVWITMKPVSGVLDTIFSRRALVSKRYDQYVRQVQAGIVNKEFDMVCLDGNNNAWLTYPGKLEKYYAVKERIPLYMPHGNSDLVMTVWEPK